MIAVVGSGLMGAATAWQLARGGHEVTLIEAYNPGHQHGSSHGSSRIFRRVYDDPFYIDLTGSAADAWKELEGDTRTDLLRTTGGLDLGAQRDPEHLAELLATAGVPHELLTAEAASERWPGIRFTGPALYHPEAGVIDADATVAACVRRATELGARVLPRVRIESVEPLGAARVLLRTEQGGAIVADSVVVAAGPWLPELGLPRSLTLPELRVTQQQVFHFRQQDPEADWPTLVSQDDLSLYGLPSGSDGGPAPAFKLAEHNNGTPTTARTRTGTPDADSRLRVSGFVRDRLPGLDPDPVGEATCLYTTTPDEDFVLDRRGPLVIVSPCSGHGAKFTPLIGAMAAALATGESEPHPRFSLARFD
ncbi:FAD-dependent oxidoreductase [Streptomyces sp. NBC_01465]|uniref:FAD-dependent oxidoreductase n=1 Tax=Streptomyces sp. NBC_01465 TaxID=2903878 RepID=UPI002E339F89|nr:FAD-dependent oxidoreductase [Streptomyces sp. NBC_01465]